MIGLPDHITACLFDLDGVLTSTAEQHKAAWRAMFNDFLEQRDGPGYVPFTDHDYIEYVDGRPRLDGVRTFLESRGIEMAEGAPDDPPSKQTMWGIGNRKNELVQKIITEQGVTAYPGSVRYIKAAKEAGFAIAVVTSSANGAMVLEAADLRRYVQVLIDGNVIAGQRLRGKPAPDSFLAGAQALAVPPANGSVFEDALSGVRAGRAGDFGCVVGVDRAGQADELVEHGADLVVKDLAELLDGRS
jgi:beta-phosphoglucomutase family hydrolase